MATVVAKDGGWCWFQNPRIVFVDGSFLLGYVASGFHEEDRSGEIRVTRFSPSKADAERSSEYVLDRPPQKADIATWLNDHNAPSFVEFPPGKVLAFWSLHGQENRFYTKAFVSSQDPEFVDRQVVTPSETSRVTYSNPVYLSEENRLYNFFRGLDNSWKPSWTYSDDGGKTFGPSRILIDVPGQVRHRPYVLYVSDGETQIHFLFTEGHPRNLSNNVYHMVYSAGEGLLRADRSLIAPIEDGIPGPREATTVFESGAGETAWVIDGRLYGDGSLGLLFQVRDTRADWFRSKAVPVSYFLARLTDGQWKVRRVADAGPALYANEEDYSGLGCLHPTNPDSVVISTRIDPRRGTALKSWTLFAGDLDGSEGGSWQRLTRGPKDNLRPQCALDDSGSAHLFWLRGDYETYQRYRLEVMHQRWN